MKNQNGGVAAKRGDDAVSDVSAVGGRLHLRVGTGRAGAGAVQGCESELGMGLFRDVSQTHVRTLCQNWECVSLLELGLVQFRDVSQMRVRSVCRNWGKVSLVCQNWGQVSGMSSC